jgi:uncharacterized membrane protein YfcA
MPVDAGAVFQLSEVSAAGLGLVAAAALLASVIGGIAGYGVGLILPIALAPAVGVANVIPVMAVATTLSNAARVAAFWRDVDRAQVARLLMVGLPACLVGAYAYTLLATRAVAAALGLFLIASVPLRRLLQARQFRLGRRGVLAAGAGFGFLDGGMTGTGVVLISILLAAGVQGAALIGTDALISALLGLAKSAVFGGAARLDAQLALAGLLVGVCTVPGAFAARWMLRHIPLRVHAALMDAVVLAGGAGFLWRSAVT